MYPSGGDWQLKAAALIVPKSVTGLYCHLLPDKAIRLYNLQSKVSENGPTLLGIDVKDDHAN